MQQKKNVIFYTPTYQYNEMKIFWVICKLFHILQELDSIIIIASVMYNYMSTLTLLSLLLL